MANRTRFAGSLCRQCVVLGLALGLAQGCAFVTRVSVTPTPGVQPDGDSSDPSISADGRYVAFASEATNLVTGDTNAYKDIFVRDNVAGTTELISQSVSGGSGNGLSGQPDISGDGRYVVFWSYADDLIPSDTNQASDVFLYDRTLGVMERISVDSSGGEANGFSLGGSVSDDGNIVAFYTDASLAANDTNGSYDIYVRDRQAGTTTLKSKNLSGGAAGSSFDPVLGRDGGSLLFWSSASDISVDDTNGFPDVFGMISILPGAILNLTSGGNGASYTGDVSTGVIPMVTFHSFASNLVPGDNDTNGVADIFIIDQGGSLVVTKRITNGNGPSLNPVIGVSAQGGAYQSVAFVSLATNLQRSGAQPLDTNGVADVYLWERGDATGPKGRIRLASRDFLGRLANGASTGRPAISADRTAIAFASAASNLVNNDTNGYEDVFARPSWEPRISSVSGDLTPGQVSQITLTGNFILEPGVIFADQVQLAGNGVVSVVVDSVTDSHMDLTIELAPDAATGPRNLIVSRPHVGLGMAPLGSADWIQVMVTAP